MSSTRRTVTRKAACITVAGNCMTAPARVVWTRDSSFHCSILAALGYSRRQASLSLCRRVGDWQMGGHTYLNVLSVWLIWFHFAIRPLDVTSDPRK